jgi:hypothetical protein
MKSDTFQTMYSLYRYHFNEVKRALKVLNGTQQYDHLNMPYDELIRYGEWHYNRAMYLWPFT